MYVYSITLTAKEFVLLPVFIQRFFPPPTRRFRFGYWFHLTIFYLFYQFGLNSKIMIEDLCSILIFLFEVQIYFILLSSLTKIIMCQLLIQHFHRLALDTFRLIHGLFPLRLKRMRIDRDASCKHYLYFKNHVRYVYLLQQ